MVIYIHESDNYLKDDKVKMFVVLTYLILVPIHVFASIEATMGLYTINRESIDIPNESVFVGTGGNVPSTLLPWELWCHGNDAWDVCTWVWQRNPNNFCQYIEDTPVNDCSDNSINIDREGNDCKLKLFSGFTKTDHEGLWACRLCKYRVLKKQS